MKYVAYRVRNWRGGGIIKLVGMKEVKMGPYREEKQN
jgi:hypothetical protein